MTTAATKAISGFFILCTLFSCGGNDFHHGTWELGVENNTSTVCFLENGKLNWELSGIKVFDNMPYKTAWLTPEKITIRFGTLDDCEKLTMQRLTDNFCVACNYKCYIDENMIDEVFIARKNGYPLAAIPLPVQQTIILPNNLKGEFFIVYTCLEPGEPQTIIISDKGTGIAQTEPNLTQLFITNRIFKFQNMEASIPVMNSNQYGKKPGAEPDSVFNNSQFAIIQKGFNQSPRNDWNEKLNENISNHINIEYFEIIRPDAKNIRFSGESSN